MTRLRRWLKYRKAVHLFYAQLRAESRVRTAQTYQQWADWYDAQVKP